MLTIILIVVTCIVSIMAFDSHELGFNRNVLPLLNRINPHHLKGSFMLTPYAIQRNKEWYRFISSGFIHANWLHLLFNMIVLYSFGRTVELFFNLRFGKLGNLLFLLLYFGALIASDLPTYTKQKNNPHYHSLGASGAVSAIVFSAILINPASSLIIFPIPIPLPAPLVGIGYLAYSYYAARNRNDGISHDSHFYGALFGFLFTLLFMPALGVGFLQELGRIFGLA